MALDSWRGLAALGVVYLHIKGPHWLLDNPFHNQLGLAVDFFFVLSGFVIAASYGQKLEQGFSLKTFMFLRLARVWPLHAVMLAGFVALELAYAALGSLSFLDGRAPFGPGRELATLPATLFLLQEYVHVGRRPWNPVSWSISVEVGLYLLGGIALRLGGRRGPWLVLAAALVAGVMLSVPVPSGVADLLRGLAGFGFGLALYEVWKLLRHWSPPHALATMAELAATLAMLLAIVFPGPRIIADAVFAAAILVFAFERGALSRLLLRGSFVWLGMLSYSIYMVHPMVLGRSQDLLALVQSWTGWRLIYARLGGGDQILMPPLAIMAFVLFVMGATIVASHFTRRFIEEPARRWSKRKAAQWGAAEAERRAPWK